MEDNHGEVWSEVALFIIITPSNGWSNRSCEPEPFYTPSTIDQEKFEELGGGHPACRVRIQPCQALHDPKEPFHGGLWFRAFNHTRSCSTTTSLTCQHGLHQARRVHEEAP